jgi:hypothetical protein
MGKTRKGNSFLEQTHQTLDQKDETPNKLVYLPFHLQLQVPQRPRKVNQESKLKFWVSICLFQIGIYVYFFM